MKSSMHRTLRSESGHVLVVTLLILFGISVMALGVVSMASVDLKITGNQREYTQALFVAEAGLNEAVTRLGMRDPTQITVDGWTGNAAISDPAAPNYDPDWKAIIELRSPGSGTSQSGSTYRMGSIQPSSGNYLTYSQSSGDDEVLMIQHKWKDRDGDGVRDADEIVRYDASAMPSENFDSGTPIEVITVTGRAGSAKRNIIAEIFPKPPISVRTLGAVYGNKQIQLYDEMNICGFNHDIATPVGTIQNACFAYHIGAGDLPGAANTGNDQISVNSGTLTGSPQPADSSTANPFFTLAEVLGMSQAEVDDLLANADQTSITNPLDGITYINGSVDINSNVTGTGLLYVNGDLVINGDMEYTGVIYSERKIDFKGGGRTWIIGTVLGREEISWYVQGSNSGILWSSEAAMQALGGAVQGSSGLLSWSEF